MKIEIQRLGTSKPIVYEDVENAYTKEALYCVLMQDKEGRRVTHKYPLCSLFRIIEDYTEGRR